MMFCASEFADVSSAWGITFNIWKSGKSIDKNNFIHKLCKTNDDGEIEVFDKKDLYNFDDQDTITTTEFCSMPHKLLKKNNQNFIGCKNIKTWTFENINYKVYPDYLCNIHIHANDISNNNWTCITNSSAIIIDPHYQNLTKSNIFEAAVVFSIRTLTEASWINDKDMYNMNVNILDEFRNDCFVNSIFGNYCCGYKVDNHRLNNEYFWMSKSEIENLAEQNNNDDVYNDVHTSSERFVYETLQKLNLSPEAQNVIKAANDLVAKSFKYRNLFNDEHPEMQINNWDAGIYQIKQLCKEYLADDWKNFMSILKVLQNKIKPQIHSLGFLK